MQVKPEKKNKALSKKKTRSPIWVLGVGFFFEKSVPGVFEFQTFLLIQLLELNNSGIHNPYTTYIIGKMLVALGWYP